MDISPEDVKKYDITLVPITVILGDTPYKDGYELNPEKIYDYVKETGNLPKTSACNAETYKEYWQPALDRGDEIIHFSFSGDMSTSCAAATTAAGELDGVSVIDTKNLSTGSGLLLMYACDLREAGETKEEIVRKVSSRVPSVQASFIIDKLNYLYKGPLLGSRALCRNRAQLEALHKSQGRQNDCRQKIYGQAWRRLGKIRKRHSQRV